MRGLKDKTAIVTGGGGAIGRAICQRLAEEGCHVGVFDKNEASANETAALLQRGSTRAAAFVVDISDHAAVASAVARCDGEIGPIDVLINNAG
jgi:2-hydroxycyclohexanecarboxyl-CoA dehydrogenase